jgi:hypothetical protein
MRHISKTSDTEPNSDPGDGSGGSVLGIRIGFNADPVPDPAIHLNADPDPGSKTNADPGGSESDF